MPTSPIGKAALIGREAVKTKAYQDTVGVWTIGVGHTAAAGKPIPKAGLTITYAQALSLFDEDIKKYETPIDKYIVKTGQSLKDHEYDALVSLCYNLGPGVIQPGEKQSSFVKAILAGKRGAEVSKLINRYTKPASIISRREAEADQFSTPYSVALPKCRSTDKSPVKVNIPPKFVNYTTIAPPVAEAATSSLVLAGQLAKITAWLSGYKTPNVIKAYELPPGFHGDVTIGYIQAALRAKGYTEVGSLDGYNGPNTQTALKNIIQDNGDSLLTNSNLLLLNQDTFNYVEGAKPKNIEPARALANVLEVANQVPEALAPIKSQTKIGVGTIIGGLGLGGISTALQSLKDMADTAKATVQTANSTLAQAQPILDFITPKIVWIEGHATLVMVVIGSIALMFVSKQVAPIIQLFRTKRIN